MKPLMYSMSVCIPTLCTYMCTMSECDWVCVSVAKKCLNDNLCWSITVQISTLWGVIKLAKHTIELNYKSSQWHFYIRIESTFTFRNQLTIWHEPLRKTPVCQKHEAHSTCTYKPTDTLGTQTRTNLRNGYEENNFNKDQVYLTCILKHSLGSPANYIVIDRKHNNLPNPITCTRTRAMLAGQYALAGLLDLADFVISPLPCTLCSWAWAFFSQARRSSSAMPGRREK